MKIILASHNLGKLVEFKKMFVDQAIDFVSSAQLNVSDVEETGTTFIDNALLKARHAAKETGLPALADDSGLVVEALNGAPGIYSARYAGEHGNSQGNIDKLLKELADVPSEKRQAHFYCALVFVRDANDPDPVICEGVWPGEIATEVSGDGGFGYDPIFYLPDLACTAAELDPEYKNTVSHRALALKQLLHHFKENQDESIGN